LRDSLVSEFKEFDSQMVFTCVGILFNKIIVLKRHQDSVSRAAVQTGLGADFANAQLLMIEAELSRICAARSIP